MNRCLGYFYWAANVGCYPKVSPMSGSYRPTDHRYEQLELLPQVWSFDSQAARMAGSVTGIIGSCNAVNPASECPSQANQKTILTISTWQSTRSSGAPVATRRSHTSCRPSMIVEHVPMVSKRQSPSQECRTLTSTASTSLQPRP